MKKKSLLVLSFAILAGSIFSLSKQESSLYRVLADEEIISINVGDDIEIENRSLTYNGETKNATCKIYFPDGGAYSGTSFIASQAGVYKLVYTADFGAHQESENVIYKCVRRSSDMFSGKRIHTSNGEYRYNNAVNTIKGAIIDMDTNAQFSYVNEIDVSSLTKNNPFIEFVIDPSRVGDADFKTLTIRLTDSIDEDNYVDFICVDSGLIDCEGRAHYIRCGANGQTAAGWEGIYEEGVGKWHTSTYGQSAESSFRALPENDSAKTLKLSMDYENRICYCTPRMWSGNQIAFINDLDNLERYAANAWNGFPSGRCKISFLASDFVNASARMVISQIGGTDLSVINLPDNNAPTIDIDYLGQNPSDLPKASLNKEYKIFPASVYDNFDKGLEADISVYYKNQSGQTIDVSVIDNKFTPKVSGTYTIAYNAIDRSGNKATEKKLQISTSDSISDIVISGCEDSYSGFVYEKINLPKLSDITTTGGTGVISLSRHLYSPSGEEIIIEKDTFMPTELGNYTLSFVAIDHINNTTIKNVSLTINPLTKPMFLDKVMLPPVFIKGFTYTLPKANVIETYNNDIVTLDAKVYVNDVEAIDNKFVSDGVNATVKYVANGQTGTTEDVYVVTSIDTNNAKDKTKYFVGNVEAKENEDDICLTSNVVGNTTFANKLSTDDFSIYMRKDPSNTRYEQLVLTLSDTVEMEKSITFKINVNSNSITLNNGQTNPFNITNDNQMRFLFQNSTGSIFDVSEINNGKITQFDDGTPFTGFNDGCYLNIAFSNVTGKSNLFITKLNNQSMGHKNEGPDYGDTIKPVIVFKDELVVEQKIGTKLIFPNAKAYDVLSDVENISLRINDPSGKNVFNDDITKGCDCTIDQYGSYMLIYTVYDKSDNKASLNKTIFVYDEIAPTLSVEEMKKTSYKVGDKVTIPGYSVSDNSETIYVDVILILPNNESRLLIHDVNGEKSYTLTNDQIYPSSFRVDKTSFRLEYAGTYTFRFIAYDDQYNSTAVEINFQCK